MTSAVDVQHRTPGRVWIITPGTHVNQFNTAHTAGADVAIVDLEDSVAPDAKAAARWAAPQFLDWPNTPTSTLGIRMNSPATIDGASDLHAINSYTRKPAIIVVPKVESARDIEIVAGVLDTDSYRPHLWALIETPRAFDRLTSITTAPRLAGVIFGAADYATSVGCALAWEPLLYARSALVNSAAAAGLPALDAPLFDLNDVDALRREADQARQLGCYGKAAVHPRQVAIIRDVFTPTDEEIDHARAIVAAAQTSAGGITTTNGRMVGTPFFGAAHKLLTEVDG